MRINNYQGTVADRPIDTVIVEPAATETPQLPTHRPGFMNNVLSRLNNQNNVIPAGNLPVYDKG
jgi:hypothetical protein